VTVAVVTDSAAALPADLVERFQVTVVPMTVTVGGRTTLDGDTPVEALLEAQDLETSGPSPGDFVRAIDQRAADGEILVLTLASTMSSTYQSAVLAAGQTATRVRVVDTQTAAGAEALVVLAAARAAASGAPLDAVAAVAERVISRVRLVAMVPDLAYLARSGRVPGIAQRVGRRLGVAPLFEFVAGRVHPLRPALGVDAAYDRLVQRVVSSREDGADLHVAAYHAMCPEAAAELLRRVERVITPASAFVGEFGSVMVAHTGPGLVGLAWWWEPAAGR
jgi:DegV family protein with EDD domain